jgi:hypothetical protein
VWGGAPTDRAQAEEGHAPGVASAAGTAAERSGARDRAAWGSVPIERVKEAGQALPAGDRSAFAGAARAAVENHPGDRAAAWREFRHAAISQYAGREGMSVEQREAVAGVAAAPPERVWEAFRPDYERFQWREPTTGAPPTGGYDPALFRFGHGDTGRGGGR